MKSESRLLNFQELPNPFSEKTGWPWNERNSSSIFFDDDSELPKISIVTPTYNYGHFIEETIRSVLLQNYPNIEYIIIDGGSTDNTIEIISKYDQHLTYWISEPDQGQTDAINKGFKHCTGDLFVWINSDDAFMDANCLADIAKYYQKGYQLIVGQCKHVDINDNPICLPTDDGCSKPQVFIDYCRFWSYEPLPQPATFIDRALASKSFPLDLSLHIAMDYQYFLRTLSHNPKSIWVDQYFVKFRFHGGNKTTSSGNGVLSELYGIATSEAVNHLLPWENRLFRIDADDQLCLLSLVNKVEQKELNLVIILEKLLKRPTLSRWLLFWKIFAKILVGRNIYNNFKKTILQAYIM